MASRTSLSLAWMHQAALHAGAEVDHGTGFQGGVVLSRPAARAAAFLIAQPVVGQVGGDAEQPGGELGRGGVSGAGAVDAQEDLLGELLGDGGVLHQAIEKMDDRGAVAGEQQVETGRVAISDAQHQGGVEVHQRGCMGARGGGGLQGKRRGHTPS